MRMTKEADLAGFKVVDSATGAEIKDDDWTLEYATGTGAILSMTVNFLTGATTVEAVDETVTKVSRVSVDWAARVIHVNEPPSMVSGISVRELHACGECCQEDVCRRIHYCAAWRCGFGEAAKP